jgi:hypothetical protein
VRNLANLGLSQPRLRSRRDGDGGAAGLGLCLCLCLPRLRPRGRPLIDASAARAKPLQEEFSEDRLKAGHFGVARAVVDVEDEVLIGVAARSVVPRPDEVEVDEVQAHCPPDLAGDPVDEVLGRRYHLLGALVVVAGGEEGDVGEGGRGGGGGVPDALRRHVRQAGPHHARGAVAHHVHLEEHAAVVGELLQHERRAAAEAAQALAAVHQAEVVRRRAAVHLHGLGDEREPEAAEAEHVVVGGVGGLLQGPGVVDHDLTGHGHAVEPRDDVQHGEAVQDAVDGGGRVDDWDVRVERREGLQPRAPRLAVQLVHDEVQLGALLRERPGGVERHEPDAVLRCQVDERRLDEGIVLVGQHRVADGVCGARPRRAAA